MFKKKKKKVPSVAQHHSKKQLTTWIEYLKATEPRLPIIHCVHIRMLDFSCIN